MLVVRSPRVSILKIRSTGLGGVGARRLGLPQQIRQPSDVHNPRRLVRELMERLPHQDFSSVRDPQEQLMQKSKRRER
jgi:hypothetical protein